MQSLDDNDAIQKLIQTVARLLRERQVDRISWKIVAKQQEGSEEYADDLNLLAEQPNFRGYFVFSRKKVKLSEEGLRLVGDLPKKPASFMQQIGSAVINYARTLWPLRLEIDDIATIAPAGNRIVHAVLVSSTDNVIASETPVDLCPTDKSSFYGSKFHGKIVGRESDGSALYIAFDTQILPACLPAFLSIDRGFLLHQLATQLNDLENSPPLVEQIFSRESSSSISLVEHQDSKAVADSLAALATSWTRFLWGPPGAGKTFALGQIITQLLRSDPHGKILLVAPSNRAVDVATEQLVARLEEAGLKHVLESREILRFGYPRKSTVLQYPELLGPIALDKLSATIKELSIKIETAERTQVAEDKIAILKAERLEAQEAVKKALYEHVKQSRVVLTTTTMAYMASSPVSEIPWSTVLIDEVTMVPPAMCAFLGSLASKRLLLAGDPRQLGPIYEESRHATTATEKWMGRDIFEISGVSSGKGESREIKTGDFRLTRITSQRRCATEIWEEVEHLYPKVENAVDQQSLNHLVNLSPLPGKVMVLLDTSDSAKNIRCESEYKSWKNKYTAELAMQVVDVMVAETKTDISIAVISPYRAQTKLFRQLIREARTNNPQYESVEAGTVHQFQGSDADVVIFDLVDGPKRKKPGKLLQGDTGIRLVNVAITRARGKVVLLANKTCASMPNLRMIIHFFGI